MSFLPGDFLSVLSIFSGDSISNFEGDFPDESLSCVDGSLSFEVLSFVLKDLTFVLNSASFSQSNPWNLSVFSSSFMAYWNEFLSIA